MKRNRHTPEQAVRKVREGESRLPLQQDETLRRDQRLISERDADHTIY